MTVVRTHGTAPRARIGAFGATLLVLALWLVAIVLAWALVTP